MLDQAQKRQLLGEIAESPEFKDSQRYLELLRYLVEETIAGNVPKEVTVAKQIFGKDASFDPKEDPIVRVYVNNLRKKLEHYYMTSEKPHAYALSIPRGHYKVEFLPVAEKDRKPVTGSRSVRYGVWAVVVLGSLGLGYLAHRMVTSDEYVAEAHNPIWSEFARPNGRPTLILLGDFFFLYERTEDGTIGNFIRDLKINTPEDYRQVIKQDPGFAKRFGQSNFTFLRPSASWGLAQILPIIEKSPNGYSLKLASQFTVDDLKSNNIVFIGSFKTLFNLNKFLHIFGLECTISPASFRIRGGKGDTTQVFAPTELRGGDYEKDYAVVAKQAGPDGCTLMLLLGFADTGVIEATRAVSSPQMLESVGANFLKGKFPDPFYFTMVVETEGINQAIFKSDIRFFSQTSQPADSTAVR